MIVARSIFGNVSRMVIQTHTRLMRPQNQIGSFKLNCILDSFKYNFATSSSQFFIFNVDKQPQLLQLQLEYRSQQKVSIFQRQIRASTGILDQMNIFKIFKVMQTSPYNHESYEQFYEFVRGSIKRKSDNLLLLLATVKERMAKYYKQQKNIQKTIVSLEQALQILEQCMVPPLMAYYSTYREYGLVMNQIGNSGKARQVLIESVSILDEFVSHSDDNVSSNNYCRKQAAAYNVLAVIDEVNSKKWVQKAIGIWQKYSQNRFIQVQYAKSVSLNIRKEMGQNKQKGEAYYQYNMYKFEGEEMRGILRRARDEVMRSGDQSNK